MSGATPVVLGFGSNQGERLRFLAEGLARIAAAPGVRLLRASSVYETEPVGGPPQPPYLNAAALVATTLAPRALLDLALRTEAAAGRVRTGRDHPRTLDVDLLVFGARVLSEPDLELPHPRFLERAFALVPAAEVAPALRHPRDGRTLAALAAARGTDGVRRVAGPAAWAPDAAAEAGGAGAPAAPLRGGPGRAPDRTLGGAAPLPWQD